MKNMIAEALACAEAKDQADTFNEFVLVLSSICKVKPSLGVDTQIHWIAHHVTGETVEFFRNLIKAYEYLNLEADKKKTDYKYLDGQVRELEKLIAEKRKTLEELS